MVPSGAGMLATTIPPATAMTAVAATITGRAAIRLLSCCMCKDSFRVRGDLEIPAGSNESGRLVERQAEARLSTVGEVICKLSRAVPGVRPTQNDRRP